VQIDELRHDMDAAEYAEKRDDEQPRGKGS
jgi:hypothetical protein